MTNEIKLLPCPFCGGEAVNSIGRHANSNPWNYIECLSCGASGEPEIWNNRYSPPPVASAQELVPLDEEEISNMISKEVELVIKTSFSTMITEEYVDGHKIVAEKICRKFGRPKDIVLPSYEDLSNYLYKHGPDGGIVDMSDAEFISATILDYLKQLNGMSE